MPATRFYFASNTTAEVSPAFDSGWEAPGQTVLRGRLFTTRQGSAFTVQYQSQGVGGTDTDFLWFQFVSEGISTGGAAELAATPGTIKGIFRVVQDWSGEDLQAQMVVRVVSNDGTTVRGTLLAMITSALSNEFPTVATGYTNRKFPKGWAGAGTALSAVASTVATDRVVIEVGFRVKQGSLVGDGRVEFGDSSASDLAENETGQLQDCPWVEFSADLFGATLSPRRAEVAWAEVEVPTAQNVTSVLRLFHWHKDDGIVRSDSNLAENNILGTEGFKLDADPGLPGRVRALNPNTKIICYSAPLWVQTWQKDYATINASGDTWTVHNPDTATGFSTRIRGWWDPNTQIGDTRSAAYRAHVSAFPITTYVTPLNLDGLYIDGPGIASGLHGWSWVLAPTPAQITLWRGNNAASPSLDLYRDQKTALGTKLLIGNYLYTWTGGSTYSDSSQFLSKVDGTYLEHAYNTNTATQFDPEVASIDHTMTHIALALAQNKYVIVQPRISSGTQAQIDDAFKFCFALYLMQAEGTYLHFCIWTAPFYWTAAQLSFMRTNSNTLGAPTGAYYVEAGTTSVLRRDFQGGTVRVNKHETQTQGGLAPHATTYTLTAPITTRAAEVAWAEVEVPDVAPGRMAEVAWAEFEVPSLENRAAEVAWAELEIPNADRAAEVGWAEVEVPDVIPPIPSTNRLCEVAWAELEVPSVGAPAPSGDRACEIAWAEVEIPSVVPDTPVPPSFGGGDFPDPTGTIFDQNFRPFPETPTHPGRPQFPS